MDHSYQNFFSSYLLNRTIFNRLKKYLASIFILFSTIAALPIAAQQVNSGRVVNDSIPSIVLQDNLVDLDTNRKIKIYLPPGYGASEKSYPVVYYLHTTFWNPEKMFEDGNLVNLLERGFANGVVNEFIFVAADYSTSTTGSIYENSSVSGRWLDFTVQELVPFIDNKYRTIPHRHSRAITGDFFGGRGTLKLAMVHADIFSVAYAMHPVATGMGALPWTSLPIDWNKIHRAKSYDDLEGDGIGQIFMTISQGFLPNPERPPFYCDFISELENGEPKHHVDNTLKAKKGFHLEETLAESADNLQILRGLALDWGRLDRTEAHVFANRVFSQKLEDLGISHEAEEYNGDPWNRTWTENGRFYARVLPFFERHLVFETKNP